MNTGHRKKSGNGRIPTSRSMVKLWLQFRLKLLPVLSCNRAMLFNRYSYMRFNISDYTNWEGGVKDIGCLSTGCSEYFRLAIRPKSAFTWTAYDKGTVFPYICVSKCPVNFKIYPGRM